MDLTRVLLVPFQATVLMLVAVFSVVLTVLEYGGVLGLFGILFVFIWLFKYSFVLAEHVADGRREAPVLDINMLSPAEFRPWALAGIAGGGYLLSRHVGSPFGEIIWVFVTMLLPACIAVLAAGDNPLQALNPIKLMRVMFGMGFYYLLFAALQSAEFFLVQYVISKQAVWHVVAWALVQLLILSQFSFIGGMMYLRRQDLGWVPTISPERTAEREEKEREERRARMVDEVYQKVRVGKHIDATAPLAQWFLENITHANVDASYVVEQAKRWDSAGAMVAIGSTLVRHLMRAGRKDLALSVFSTLRREYPGLELDDPADAATLAEYARSTGRSRLAESLQGGMTAVTPPK
jgi:hypothetical protein